MQDSGRGAAAAWPPSDDEGAGFRPENQGFRNVYIDPGAGSIVIQVVGSALIAVAATFGHIKRYVSRLLGRKRD